MDIQTRLNIETKDRMHSNWNVSSIGSHYESIKISNWTTSKLNFKKVETSICFRLVLSTNFNQRGKEKSNLTGWFNKK